MKVLHAERRKGSLRSAFGVTGLVPRPSPLLRGGSQLRAPVLGELPDSRRWGIGTEEPDFGRFCNLKSR